MKIDSISTFLNLIQNDNDLIMYRGHANSEWKLLPTLARLDPNSAPVRPQNGWKGIEEYLLNEFRKFSSSKMNPVPKKKIEWMIHAQHHGLPTRLLDWSSNPLKALYFCVQNELLDDFDGKVFSLKPTMWSLSSEDIDTEYENTITAFYPVLINERVRVQEGCFTLFPQRENQDAFDALDAGSCSVGVNQVNTYIVPREYKKNLRRELRRLGVNDMTMFPDLDGIAKHIRRPFRAM